MSMNPGPGLMIHSDPGVRYPSKAFSKVLQEKGCVQSMSCKGNCWDNAVAESFSHILKGQYLNHEIFKDFVQANIGIFKYIEVYYNRRKRHSANGWHSPAEYEEQWFQLQKAA